ncbi:hypothetical protein [Methylicorpusculum sp.]|uniref:hypothetical protein n=1 Tax=Methylicorpusculum sp. TaxID=2713644 RepID=UPI002726289A|nr:hypothetical protein [Methylicorpusculum sp.]MDO8844889.1 hypothetical protein [Methylicorpusculum sp.]
MLEPHELSIGYVRKRSNSQFEGKKGWEAFRECRQQGCCRQDPNEGFTAFLERLFPAQSDAENIKLGIAGVLL